MKGELQVKKKKLVKELREIWLLLERMLECQESMQEIPCISSSVANVCSKEKEGSPEFFMLAEEVGISQECWEYGPKRMQAEENNTMQEFDNFCDTYESVREKIALKTDEEGTKCALKILDMIRSQENVSIRTALDILTDAKTVLLETMRL